MDLSNKNILVTGAAGFGVGHGVATALSKMGARVIVNARKLDEAQQAASKLSNNAIAVAADITNETEVDAMFETLAKQVGVIHGLVNNAGIGLSKEAHKVTDQEFDNLYNIDVRAVWKLSKLFANQLIKSNTVGSIINISSVHASATIAKYAVYASAKSAVEGLTRGMAVELGKHHIRVNAVAPGYVHAEQNFELIKTFADDPELWVEHHTKDYQSLPFEIQAEDCGNVVGFLASEFSRAITGQVIYVDNGTTSMLYNNSFIEK
ncbi:SDR family NAD(P)-dependent oxidoreductase [Snuella sedimenti]|uniref:SDR family oxidoreductase n=1 Tax=Snuella sedimenti TaxID=2798802 RepID=A0A8J7IG13_9FLAO|nr:SDR family oxidoreductase [Snuella sedimenti]MBJ6368612.1 SDR family oxidoreductase [Snuella sedimenti]